MSPYTISQNVSKFEKLQHIALKTRLLAAAGQNLYFKDKMDF